MQHSTVKRLINVRCKDKTNPVGTIRAVQEHAHAQTGVLSATVSPRPKGQQHRG